MKYLSQHQKIQTNTRTKSDEHLPVVLKSLESSNELDVGVNNLSSFAGVHSIVCLFVCTELTTTTKDIFSV